MHVTFVPLMCGVRANHTHLSTGMPWSMTGSALLKAAPVRVSALRATLVRTAPGQMLVMLMPSSVFVCVCVCVCVNVCVCVLRAGSCIHNGSEGKTAFEL